MRVAIFTDETGWHTSRLKRALRSRGADGRCVDLADCHFDTGASSHGIMIPGFGKSLPDAAIVRGLAGGSFEQVTKRLGVLHALRECSVPVYNDARAIERSVDKSMTSFLLHRAGVPTPRAVATESRALAQRVVMREAAAGGEAVLKPLFGSQGKDLLRLGGEQAALPASLAGAPYGDTAYLQRFVAPAARPGFDWRVLVVGGRAIAAMRRVSEHWIHNVAQGARCERAEPTPQLAGVAERAADALALDYAGVDLMPIGDGGMTVIEVNGVAAWRGLQRVTDFDIAQAIVDDLLARRIGRRIGAA